MLSSVEAAKLINAINVAFDKIGKVNGTAMPKSDNNLDSTAYDLFIADHLARRAKSRKDEAHKNAVNAGVLFDHTKEPREPGNYALFSGDIVAFTCNVKSPASFLDAKTLRTLLIKQGMPAELVDKLIAQATSKRAPAHTFTGALMTNNE